MATSIIENLKRTYNETMSEAGKWFLHVGLKIYKLIRPDSFGLDLVSAPSNVPSAVRNLRKM